MSRVSNPIAARPQFAPPPPPPPLLSRQKRDDASAPQPEVTTRAGGDNELAMQYMIALNLAGNRMKVDDFDHIPPHSTFGQWWKQLHDAFQSPDVQQWIRATGIDTSTIKLDPKSGQLSYSLERRLDPQRTLHTVGQDDSQWAAISGPILQAARVIGTEFRFAPPVNSTDVPVPWWIVGHFYQEPQNLTLAGMHRRADEISSQQNFKPLDPTRFADLIKSRSEDALQDQQAVLGDIRNRYQAGEALQRLATALSNGSKDVGQIQAELQKTVPLSADGTYFPKGAGESNEVSLTQLLEDHGWDIPTTHEQVVNLANALTTAPPKAATHGDLGGALSWPVPLDQQSQEQLREAIRAGELGGIPLTPFNNVLDYLLNGRPITTQEHRNPRLLIDTLLSSPRGIELGKALEASFAARSVKGSASDWLLAALNVGSTGNAGSAGEATAIEGYQLVSVANHNKHPSAVFEALAAHLVSNGTARSLDTARVHAHLMLASRAPEFLVKDIPKEVGVGTHSWVSFTTAVARIEAKAPGATAAMSYAQIMLAASTAPISEDERQVEYAAQNQAIKEWAIPHGMDYPTTDTALAEVRKEFDAQLRVLSAAAETPDIKMPMTDAIATELMKQALPGVDPKLFDKKCIRSKPSNRHFPGPYSLKDLFRDGRALVGAPPDSNTDWGVGRGFFEFFTGGGISIAADGTPAVWVSSSADVNVNEMLPKLKDLPRPQEQFDADFAKYEDAIKKTTSALFKYGISKLPLEDQQHLQFGEITVRREIDYDRPDLPQRTENGVLLFETKRNINGKLSVMTYAYDRLKGTFTRRPGKTYQERVPSEGWYPAKGKKYDLIKPAGQHPPGITDERPGAQGVPNSFSSDRTHYLIDAVIEDMELPAVRQYAKGASTFETEVPTYKIVGEIALNLIPLRSAIINFKEGKITEGIVDLAFDVFGFVVGLGAAAKAAKALSAGASALSKAAQAVKIIGRAAVGALNPVGGIDDLARGVFQAGGYVVNKTYKGVKQLRAAYSGVNLLELAKKGDVAQGTIKAANGAGSRKVLAQRDEATGQWYDFNPRTKKSTGNPMTNFVPDAPVTTNANSLHAIASDDVVKTASQRYGLAATGRFKVGQETVEGPAVMYQGNWHQYDPLKNRAFGPPLLDFTPTRVAVNGEVITLDPHLTGYEAKYIASDALSTQGTQGNVYVGASKKEYVKVDGLLYESRLKDGQRVILHPKGAGPDVPVKDLGVSGWVPAARADQLLGGASSAPGRWDLGHGRFAVPIDDIHETKNSATPFSLTYEGLNHKVTFDSTAGAWTETQFVYGTDKVQTHFYYWRTGKGQWQRGTFDEFSNAKKLESKLYKLVNISTPLVLGIPKDLKPVPTKLHYFWAGKEIPPKLIETMAHNARQTPGFTSILHVDADSQIIFQQIKAKLQSEVPGITVVNLHEDKAFEPVLNSELYRYYRQGQGKNLAAASDVARYPIMHKYGGAYLDTDDVIQNTITSDPMLAGANDILLGGPTTHWATDNNIFYNTSHFATRPGNPLLLDIIEGQHKRFKENKTYFAANREYGTVGADGVTTYPPAFQIYEKKIFDTVGPNLFNDILKSKRPDMYEAGFDGAYKKVKRVGKKVEGVGPVADIAPEILEGYRRNGITPPDRLANRIQQMKEHYLPLQYRFNIKVGSEHSWAIT